MCLLLFEFSTEGFDEIFSDWILVPAKLSEPEVALPEMEAPETEEAEVGWRFSRFLKFFTYNGFASSLQL